LRDDIKTAMAIEDPAERDAAIKLMLKRVDELSVVVETTMVQVDKNIDDLTGRTWWATQEAVNRDLMGLRRGKEGLIAKREELSGMKVELSSYVKVDEKPGDEPTAKN
jgi:hypothetical protein